MVSKLSYHITTWGRFGFDGGKMGLISEPRQACHLDNKVCIKYKRRR